MGRDQEERIPRGIASVYAPIPLLIFACLLIFFAYGYGQTAGKLPVLVGAVTLVLLVLDIVSRLPGRVGVLVRSSLGAGFQDPEMKHGPRFRSEIVQVIWVVFCVISVVLVGILVTIPLFIFLYMVVQGKQSIRSGLTVSVLTLLAVALLFSVLLDYELYKGLLFSTDDF